MANRDKHGAFGGDTTKSGEESPTHEATESKGVEQKEDEQNPVREHGHKK